MKKRSIVLLMQAFLFCTAIAQHGSSTGKSYEFKNGQWFNGAAFVQKTMYVKDGYFTDARPQAIDSVIDLKNKFVVPPYSESHTHHLEGVGAPPEQLINSYLKDGVFYVKNPNNVLYFTKNLFGKINKPTSLDASFANGGLTANEGHPMAMFEDQIRPGIEPMTGKTERGWFHGKAYYTVDSEKDLNDKWTTILADKPDFIKVYLANSEDYGKQSPPSKYKLRSGLNPALLPAIVAKAHQAGLRVAAHVETANDFRTAINAGVDELAHMPGFYLFDAAYSDRYLLTDADAKLAADKNVFVVTTLMTRTLVEDKSLLPTVAANQKKNLLLLKKYGVRLAIGSDHSDSPLEEIKAIRELNVFTNLELLKLWCENSAQYIFPKRKIGFLKPGYEASFLVLDGDPLKDWNNTGKIILRFKQGSFMHFIR
ncbi:MAG: amidohydrolase family protein [Ferruginibacter sp.]